MRRMKKCMAIVMALSMAFGMFLTNAESVLAEEADVIDVGAYLDEETPEKVVEQFPLEETSGNVFGTSGKAYKGNGINIEWQPDNGTNPVSMVATTIQVDNNTAISYHGIYCGSTEKQVNQILKEQGWMYWGKYPSWEDPDILVVTYQKETDKMRWFFEIELKDGKVISWDWGNWVQGDMGHLPYEDVEEESWYYPAVDYVHCNWLMTGTGNGVFGPAESLARAQFAMILYRMNEEPEVEYSEKFPDISNGIWYTDAILWAAETGVVTGYSDTKLFGPSDLITREQMAVMMYRYAGYKKYDISQKTDYQKFTDAETVSEFAKDAMQWAVGSGIITGKDNETRLDPQGNANRAECATIIMRFVEKYGK